MMMKVDNQSRNFKIIDGLREHVKHQLGLVSMSVFDAVDGSPPTRQPVGVGKMEGSHGVCGDNRIGPWEVSIQVHGVDAGGVVVIQRRLTRGKLLGSSRSIAM